MDEWCYKTYYFSFILPNIFVNKYIFEGLYLVNNKWNISSAVNKICAHLYIAWNNIKYDTGVRYVIPK